MCKPNASLLHANLNLNDTPVGYAPQLGPDVFIQLSYNHLDTVQPPSPNYSNLGPRWTHNFLSYIQDDPTAEGFQVTRYVPGGGAVDYTENTASAFNYMTGLWGAEDGSLAILKRIPATGTLTSYTLTSPDGTVHTFAELDGASTYPRRVFLTTITDPQGNSLALDYDGSLRLTTITDAAGRDTTFAYNGASKLIESITDPFGRAATLTYGSGKLTDIEDVLGIVSSFTYDGTDPYFISGLTTPYGNSTFDGEYNVATGDRALELTDAEGFTERVEYLHEGAPGIAATEAATPSGMTVENGEYDNRNTFYWDKEVYPTYGTGMGKDYTKAVITHWPMSKRRGGPEPWIASIKNPLEGRIYYTYPGQASGKPELAGTFSKPSAIGRVLDDSSTQKTLFTYNAKGFVTQETDPLGRVTKYTYAGNNIDLIEVEQKTSATPTWATLAEYTYDTSAPIEPPHKPLTHTDAAGRVWSYGYNAEGQLETVTDPLSNVTTYNYDADGRLDTIVNDNSTTVLDFDYPSCMGSDNCDLPELVTDGRGFEYAYTYDALDRVTAIAYPNMHGYAMYNIQSEAFDYTGSMGKDMDLISHTDRMGRVTSYAYDDNRRLIEVEDPELNTVSFEYYKNDRLKKIIDGNGNETLWTVDVQGRPTLKTFDDAETIAYVYETKTSRISTITDALAQVKTFGYNNADEITSIGYTSEVVSTPDVTVAYDSWFPRRTSMTDGIGTTTWSYIAVGTDGALQLDTENGPYSNDSAVHAYDDLGRVDTLTVGGTTAETFTYDNLGRLHEHDTSMGEFEFVDYVNDTNIPEFREHDGNAGLTRGWQYQSDPRWGMVREIYGSNSDARELDYEYDTTGVPWNVNYNIIKAQSAPQGSHPWSTANWTYAYDDTDRLLTAGDGTTSYTFAYDDAYNPTTFGRLGSAKSPTYNGMNEVAVSMETHTFDDMGNETASTTAGTALTYDAENRLKTVTNGSGTLTMTYDGLGRRLGMAWNNGMTTTTRRYQWCSDQLCAKRDGSDTVLARYFGLEAQHNIGGTELILMTDVNGSVRDVVDEDGDLLYAVDFTPYGEIVQSTGSGRPDMLFAGLFYEPNTGLYFSNTRAYDPKLGRWMSRDTIEEQGGINLYEYVGGNPIMYIDPEGTQRWLPLPRSIPIGRGGNKLQPHPEAEGPHGTFRRGPDGQIQKWQEWTPKEHPQQRHPWTPGNRYDGTGKPHGDTPTPHIHDKEAPGGVRPPNPWEIPGKPMASCEPTTQPL